MKRLLFSLLLALTIVAASCGSTAADAVSDAAVSDAATAADAVPDAAVSDAAVSDDAGDVAAESVDDVVAVEGDAATYAIEVWADNWSAVYVDGELVGEDSVSITTERSFNAETYTFEATLPFTVAIEAKDFTETDSGLEYIGERNQQMGDGGIIAQVTNTETGEVVAATDGDWSALVVYQAPLNVECEDSADPDAECEFLYIDTPVDWASVDFDPAGWTTATVWSAADVDPKDGYDEIGWDDSAELIWGTDLEVDNTVLLRTTVG